MKNKNRKEVSKDEFRQYKKTKHPTYIYAKVGNEYKFIGLTHAEVTQGVKNIKLDKNPNPKDKRSAYFRPKAEKDKVNKFKKKEKGWKFSKSDKQKISRYKK